MGPRADIDAVTENPLTMPGQFLGHLAHSQVIIPTDIHADFTNLPFFLITISDIHFISRMDTTFHPTTVLY
jgi:hypothetical protein